jgi:hypothetical protein
VPPAPPCPNVSRADRDASALVPRVPTVARAARGPAADPRRAAAERALALLTALLAHARLFSRASEAPLAPGALGAQLSAAAVDARLEHIPYCTEVVRGAAAARALPPGDAPDAILARAGLALACLEEIARTEPPPAPPMRALAAARAPPPPPPVQSGHVSSIPPY